MLSYVILEISLWRKLKRGGAFFSVMFSPFKQQGAGYVRHKIVTQVNMENLIIFRVSPGTTNLWLKRSSLGLSAWSQCLWF